MRTLSSKVKDLPVVVVSAVVLKSAARFGGDSVVQLLNPQSAINHLLSHGTLFHCLFHCFILLFYFIFSAINDL